MEGLSKGVYQEGHKLWYKGKAYVEPHKRPDLIKEIHESRLGGHMGIAKTVAKIQQHYDFPGLRAEVKIVVSKYDICLRSKAARHKPYRLLQPLLVAEQP